MLTSSSRLLRGQPSSSLHKATVLMGNAAHNRTTSNGDSVCIPANGYTALIIGQDYVNIANYTSNFGFASGYMSYTALRSPSGDLAGLTESVDYGSGVECAKCLIDDFKPSILQLGLWLVGSLPLINQGFLDENIRQFVLKLNAITYNSDSNENAFEDTSSNRTNTHILLRIGYEFDNPFNYYDPYEYKESFRRIVNMIKKEKSKSLRVSFVWHSYGDAPAHSMKAADWYPGDDYVDICSVSIFQQPFQCHNAFKCNMKYIDDLFHFCKNVQHKPLMIGESSPFGGIVDSDNDDDDKSETEKKESKNEIGVQGSSWNRWFQVVISYIERHDIQYFSYISCNWDEQPMWRGAKFGDSRIQNFKITSKKWTDEILSSKRFSWNKVLARGGDVDDVICRLGYSPDVNMLVASYVAMLLFMFLSLFCLYRNTSKSGLCGSNIVNRLKNNKGQYVELRDI